MIESTTGWRRGWRAFVVGCVGLLALTSGASPEPALAAASRTTVADPAPASAPYTFRNPIRSNSADPWMFVHDGWYYLTSTQHNYVSVKKARTIVELGGVPETVLWRATPEHPDAEVDFWAPEFHRIGDRWYVYFTARPVEVAHQYRVFVLESAGSDPMGPYTFRGKLATPGGAIDGSVMRMPNGRWYFLWANQGEDSQNVYISAMANPWTLTGPTGMVAKPTLPWEQFGSPVNEGPVALQRDGKTFLVYSASNCGTLQYRLGMLTYLGGDPVAASSWRKSPEPVFQSAPARGVYGPGHNGFFTSPDGTETWIVYHALSNPEEEKKCGPARSTRMQRISWRADGTPDFGVPRSTATSLPAPSGDTATPPRLATGWYRISPRNVDAALDVGGCSADAGANVITWPYWGGECQQWWVESVGDSYRITARNSGHALTAAGCDVAEAVDVRVDVETGSGCQRWHLDPVPGGHHRINTELTGQAMEVEGCSTADGADVRTGLYAEKGCQQWRLDPIS